MTATQDLVRQNNKIIEFYYSIMPEIYRVSFLLAEKPICADNWPHASLEPLYLPSNSCKLFHKINDILLPEAYVAAEYIKSNSHDLRQGIAQYIPRLFGLSWLLGLKSPEHDEELWANLYKIRQFMLHMAILIVQVKDGLRQEYKFTAEKILEMVVLATDITPESLICGNEKNSINNIANAE